jgi:hypothetical protein
MEGLDGILKCYVHKVSFNTPTEYFDHEREIEHERNENHLCGNCGSEIKGKGPRVQVKFVAKLVPDKLHHPRANCKKCQDEIDKATIERLKAEGKI